MYIVDRMLRKNRIYIHDWWFLFQVTWSRFYSSKFFKNERKIIYCCFTLFLRFSTTIFSTANFQLVLQQITYQWDLHVYKHCVLHNFFLYSQKMVKVKEMMLRPSHKKTSMKNWGYWYIFIPSPFDLSL